VIEISPRTFRDTLGRYPTGVCVITMVDADGKWQGVTIGSFASLSLDPPLVQFSLDKSAICHPAFISCEKFAVNVLSEDQSDLSGIFASKQAERPWGDVRTRIGESGAPLLEGACAVIECEREAVYPGGDHDIIVGRVIALDQAVDGRPLIYFGAGYRSLNTVEV
jgi:3-hydroxy-9,10-secoandrosta-1,3,5(10)-triene-9,17-dione monooxygenase reductase component